MWAVHIVGPDDVHAAPDRQIADAFCLVLNRQFDRHKSYGGDEPTLRAEVIEWPYGYEDWAADKDALRLEVIGA
jgi:hypothetical protein